MDENSNNIKRDWHQQYFLGKLLLNKYHAVHEMHLFQLRQWPIACCNITIEGEVSFDIDQKSVTYNLKTVLDYYLTKNDKGETEIKKRNKNSPFRYIAKVIHPNKNIGKYIIRNSKKHKEELKIAHLNLTTWTKELLWGEATKVKVIIDGQSI